MDSSTESSMEMDRRDEPGNRTEEAKTRTRSGSARSVVNSASPSQTRASLIPEAKQDQQGTASCASFRFFFCGTLLLAIACTLLSTGVWCFLVRLPVMHLAREPTRIVAALSGYMVAAATLTFPASCVLYREHNVTRPRRSLLPTIVMLSVSMTILAICASHAIVYRKSAYSNLDSPVILLERLHCCGMNGFIDWVSNSTLSDAPPSCHTLSHDEDDNSGEKKITQRPGCLDAITLDLMWITAYIVGLCFIAIFSDLLVILSIGGLPPPSDWRAD